MYNQITIGGVRIYARMLVPLDGSELAEVVFTDAKELTGRLGLDLILLHLSSSIFLVRPY